MVGDFNHHITWTSSGGVASVTASEDIEFLDTVNSCLLTQFVYEPTFGENQLDLVLADDPNSVFNLQIGPPLGNTDKGHLHATLTFDLLLVDAPAESSNIERLNYDLANFNSLNAYLCSIDWNLIFAEKNTDDCYTLLLLHYNAAVAMFVPIRQPPSNKAKQHKKYFNEEIKRATKAKFSSFARLRAAPRNLKPSLQRDHNQICRKVKALVLKAIKVHELNIASKCKTDPKLLYSEIKKQQKIKERIHALVDESGSLTSDPIEIANLLNKQFFSVFSTDLSGNPPAFESRTATTANVNDTTFSPAAVLAALTTLNKRKPAGIDGIHPHVLHEARCSLALPLSLIFCKSFADGQVPRCWKLANITPIFKKGAKTKAENYRPISLTAVPCKLMERLFRNAMLDHLIQQKLLDPNQHGFSPGKSCVTNLLEAFDLITDAMESRYDIVLILLDFAKAFDKVSHALLLHKLRAYGFDEATCRWIGAFLADRKQRVILGDSVSEWLDVLSSVPQGSCIGPLLFIIFINDMPGLVRHFCKLFADDTKLIAVIKSPSDLVILQEDLDRVTEWANTWLMSFNEDKCKAMFIDKRRHNLLNTAFVDELPGSHTQLTMTDKQGNTHVLDETTTERDLGVIVHNRFLWHDQVANAKSRAYKALGMLKRTFKHWTIDSFRILYCTYVRIHLEYCSAAWGPFSREDIDALEAVQNNATKLVPCLRPLKSEQRLAAIGIQSLADRRRRGDLIQYFKIHHGFNKVNWTKPASLAPSLTQLGPAGGLRGAAHRLEAPLVDNCAARSHFLANRVAADWSALSTDIINSPNTNSFKIKLDRNLFMLPKRT